MSATLGSRIKAARVRAKLTQVELAKIVGCSQQTIVDIEARSSRSRFLPAIANALGESLEWFESGEGSEASAALLVPHYDLYGLAAEHPVPLDRIFGAVDPQQVSFTVSVDAGTIARSKGYLAPGDVVFCSPPNGTPAPWVIAWVRDWPKAELCRLAVSEGHVYLCSPNGDEVDFKIEVCLVKTRAEAAADQAEGRPPKCWIVASVFGIMRPC